MINKILLAFVVLGTSTMSFAQNSSTETRTSKPYHFICIKGELNVRLEQDEVPGVVVKGTTYQIGNTATILHDDTLFVYQTNVRTGDGTPELVIHVNELVLLEVTGKTRVDCSGLINTDYLTLRAKDGAQIKLNVRALKVESRASGRSRIDLEGSAVSKTEAVDGFGIIESGKLDVMEHENAVIRCLPC